MTPEKTSLETLTEDTNYILIQSILAHPKNLPTRIELAYIHPDFKYDEIKSCLQTLINQNLVKKHTISQDKANPFLATEFYGITPYARTLLKEENLLPNKENINKMYDVIQQDEYMKQYINAPRP